MVSEWRVSTWGEEVSLEYGKALGGYRTEKGAYRVFGSNGPIGWHSEFLASGPGVILGRKGAYRGVEYSREPFWVIDTAYYVIPKTKLDLRWLYFAIKHYKLGEIDDGSPIPSTTRAAVYVKELLIPPLREQQAIASILGSLDDKIELNRQRNRTLEATARALFQSWFVDFDPVKAKAAGKNPPGLKPEIAAHFPDSLEATEIGVTPSGWRIASVLDLCDLLSGGTPDTSEEAFWNGDIKWASAKDVSQAGQLFLISTERSITEVGLENSATRIIPVLGSVVVARGATTGRMVMFGSAIAMNQTCYALRSKNGNHYFLNQFLQFNLPKIVHTAHGSVFDTITTASFKQAKLLIPSEALASKFDSIVRPIFCEILRCTTESNTLTKIRDTLLPALVSGKLRIARAERIVSRVL